MTDRYPWETLPPDPHEPDGPPEYEPEPTPGEVELASTAVAVLDYTNPDDVRRAARALRDRVVEAIRERHAELMAGRAADGGQRATVGDLSREIRHAADAVDAVKALADALLAGKVEAEGILRELVEELGRRSARLDDGHGSELAVTLEQRRELSVDVDKVVAVLRGALAYAWDGNPDPAVEQEITRRDAYLQGVDDGIKALRDLLSSTPPFRTTALDALAKRLAGFDDGRRTLAAELERAYARVVKGEPAVKVARHEPEPEATP